MPATPGERFAAIRRRKHFSQDDLGKAAELTDQAISDFEKGRSQRMQAKTWRRVARALGYTPEDLASEVFGAAADVIEAIATREEGVALHLHRGVIGAIEPADIELIEKATTADAMATAFQTVAARLRKAGKGK